MAFDNARNIESCFGKAYLSAIVLEFTSLRSIQKRGFPFCTTTITGEETGELDGSMMSSSFSFSTASLISFRFRGDVRYDCWGLIVLCPRPEFNWKTHMAYFALKSCPCDANDNSYRKLSGLKPLHSSSFRLPTPRILAHQLFSCHQVARSFSGN